MEKEKCKCPVCQFDGTQKELYSFFSEKAGKIIDDLKKEHYQPKQIIGLLAIIAGTIIGTSPINEDIKVLEKAFFSAVSDVIDSCLLKKLDEKIKNLESVIDLDKHIVH